VSAASRKVGGAGHAAHRGGSFDRHRNPEHFAHYLGLLEGEDRASWQEPDRVLSALGLRPGATVCDLGAGPGYFTLRLARAVGRRGAVHALDVEPRMVRALRARVRAAGVENVRPALVSGSRASLPPAGCDLILIVNTFHHLPAGASYLRQLASRLSPGGRLVNIDFHRRALPVGPPSEHKVARRDFLARAREAGLSLVREHRFLRYQYFLELSREGAIPGPGGRRPSRPGAPRRPKAVRGKPGAPGGGAAGPRPRRSGRGARADGGSGGRTSAPSRRVARPIRRSADPEGPLRP